MFLQSCASLVADQPTLAELIHALDERLAQMGPNGEVRPEELAYLLNEDPHTIEAVLDELVKLNALERERRVFCENDCFCVTTEELSDAQNDGETIRCPLCDTPLRDSVQTRKNVYVLRTDATDGWMRLGSVPDGRRLGEGRSYTMLFVAADPSVDERLALDREWRRIESSLSARRCKVELNKIDRWATTTHDLRQALLDHAPTIVHFSGHGRKLSGLSFADDRGEAHLVSGPALAELFRLSKETIECVLLNACYSADQACSIAEHVHCVVGMRGEIDDEAAIQFAAGFYDALTAGQSFGRCFEFGANAIDLSGLGDSDRPAIWIDGIRYS